MPGPGLRARVPPRLRSMARILLAGVAGALAVCFLLLLPDLVLAAIPAEAVYYAHHPFLRILGFAAVIVLGPEGLAAALRSKAWPRLRTGLRAVAASPPVSFASAAARRAAASVGAAVPTRVARLDALAAARRAAVAVRATLPTAAPRLEALPGYARLEALCRGVLSWPLTAATIAACGLFLACWVPHYLTWPWWPDTDQFAVSALLWNDGLRPYRDLLDFDFPAPIYVHYVLGTIFGWGRTAPFNAVDAGAVVLLGAALISWSRRLFSSAFPGALAYIGFLGSYLGYNFSLVAQREWHATLFVVLGLLALEAWPDRRGRLASALAMAVALAFRPQVVLFLPAMLAALDEGERADGASHVQRLRPMLEWSAFLAACLVLTFSPLILQGLVDDFVRILMAARRGHYNHFRWVVFVAILREYFRDRWAVGLLTAAALLAFAGPATLRRTARTWGLAFLCAFFYRPISPFPDHLYLAQPMMLIGAVALAPIVAWLRTMPRLPALLRLGAFAVLLTWMVPHWPLYCDARRSLQAVGPLLRGEDPVEAPPGCERIFSSRKWPTKQYRWENYRALLAYLREATPRDARVANLLWAFPYPTVNGPAGRPTPFPAAGGYIHLSMVDPELVDRYVEVLERTPGLFVVWDPKKLNLDFPELDDAVRRLYRPEVRFGRLEVWLPRDSARSTTADLRRSREPARRR